MRTRLRRRGTAALAAAGLAAALAALVMPPGAQALQVLTISGTVTNAWGTPITGAAVTDGTNQGTTNTNGYYFFQETGTGSYTITVEATGMASQSATLTLGPTQPNATQNFTMRYLSGASVNQPYLSTATSSQTLTLTMQTYAPNPGTPGGGAGTSCSYVYGSYGSYASHGAPLAAMTYASTTAGVATWSWSETLAQGTPEGTYQLWTAVDDCASGVQLDSGTGPTPYVVDNTPPSISGEFPANGGWATGSPLVGASLTDAGSGLASATLSLGDASGKQVFSGSATYVGATSAQAAWQVSGFGAGTYTATLTATDRADNANSASWTFNVDTAAPVFLAQSEAPTGTTDNRSPLISVAVSDDSGIDAASVAMTLTDPLGRTTAEPAAYTNGTIRYQVPAQPEGLGVGQGPLVDGTYTVAVSAADLAGNRSPTSWTFTVDGLLSAVPSPSAA